METTKVRGSNRGREGTAGGGCARRRRLHPFQLTDKSGKAHCQGKGKAARPRFGVRTPLAALGVFALERRWGRSSIGHRIAVWDRRTDGRRGSLLTVARRASVVRGEVAGGGEVDTLRRPPPVGPADTGAPYIPAVHTLQKQARSAPLGWLRCRVSRLSRPCGCG